VLRADMPTIAIALTSPPQSGNQQSHHQKIHTEKHRSGYLMHLTLSQKQSAMGSHRGSQVDKMTTPSFLMSEPLHQYFLGEMARLKPKSN